MPWDKAKAKALDGKGKAKATAKNVVDKTKVKPKA